MQKRTREPRSWRQQGGAIIRWLLFCVGVLASVATNLADDGSDNSEEPALTNCTVDEECAAVEGALYCLPTLNVCVACRFDDHCESQQRCVEQRCVERCASDDACPEGLLCIEGVCQGCNVDTDCSQTDQYCYQGEGVRACRPLCTQSVECTSPGFDANQVCRGGRCQTQSCQEDSECLADEERCDLELNACVAMGGEQ